MWFLMFKDSKGIKLAFDKLFAKQNHPFFPADTNFNLCQTKIQGMRENSFSMLCIFPRKMYLGGGSAVLLSILFKELPFIHL